MSAWVESVETVVPRVFATTHWSVVSAAGGGDMPGSREALQELCEAYWNPIFVYVRRKGYDVEEARDLTQEFFHQLIAKGQVRLADRNKGRFRTFLLSILDYFLAREWSRAHRIKRGGRVQTVSWDALGEEEGGTGSQEPVDGGLNPEEHFQKEWALSVLRQAMKRLERQSVMEGRGTLFQELQGLLSGDRVGVDYGAMAQRLGMSEGAIRVALHRMRQRFGMQLREEIGRTLSNPLDVEDELKFLLRALMGGR